MTERYESADPSEEGGYRWLRDEAAFGSSLCQEMRPDDVRALATHRFIWPLRTRSVAVLVIVAASVIAAVVVPLAYQSGTRKPAPITKRSGPARWTAYLVGQPTHGRSQAGLLIPFDLASGAVGHPIVLPVAGEVAIAPGGRVALLVDSVSDLAYPIDLATGRAGPAMRTGSRPVSVAFTPDGRTAFVADAGADGCPIPGPNCKEKSNLVTPIDLLTNIAEPPIHTCTGPEQLAMAPSGRELWVACYFGGVDEVSTATRRVVAHYDVPGSPGNIAFADGGNTVIVGQILVQDLQEVQSFVVLIDAKTGTVSKPIRVGSPGGTSVAAVTSQGIAYISSWGHPGRNGQVTTAIAPLDLATRHPGRFLDVPESHEPVATIGNWAGLGARLLTYPNPASGDLWEGEPPSGTVRLIHIGILRFTPGKGFARILGLDPYLPYAVVAGEASLNSTSIGVIDMATGKATRPVKIDVGIRTLAVEYPPSSR